MLATGSCCCCCCAHKDTALPDGETPWPWRTNGVQNRRFPGPERPFWNLLEKVATCYTCYTFLDFSMLLCPQRHGPPGRGNTMALKDEWSPKYVFLGAGTFLLKSPRKSLLYTFLGFSMLATGSCCCCCCAHKDTALPDGETPWPWRTNGVQNRRFPGPERLFWNLLEKACFYTFLGFSMLATGSCCCCCAHKDTALPDGETPWPWRTNGVQNRRFPGPERPFWNLLEKVATCYTCYTCLDFSMLLCPQRHGPPGRGNTMALKDEWSPK